MWNAEIYEKFGKERIQPSIDLVSRLTARKFERILDAGCGTGMSTAALVSAFGDSEIIGVDLSEEMLAKARENISHAIFIKRDCSQPLSDLGKFDLIFSNAFIQWLSDQKEFMANSFRMLNEGGVFAAQIPLFGEMPANTCILKAEKLFAEKLKGLFRLLKGRFPAPVFGAADRQDR